MKKSIALMFLLVSSLCLAACSSDREDEPSGLHDWMIAKSIYNQQTAECESRWNEYLYDKTLEYVLNDKAQFESMSTSFYKWKYAYKQIK